MTSEMTLQNEDGVEGICDDEQLTLYKEKAKVTEPKLLKLDQITYVEEWAARSLKPVTDFLKEQKQHVEEWNKKNRPLTSEVDKLCQLYDGLRVTGYLSVKGHAIGCGYSGKTGLSAGNTRFHFLQHLSSSSTLQAHKHTTPRYPVGLSPSWVLKFLEVFQDKNAI